jgi:hypothetical protein
MNAPSAETRYEHTSLPWPSHLMKSLPSKSQFPVTDLSGVGGVETTALDRSTPGISISGRVLGGKCKHGSFGRPGTAYVGTHAYLKAVNGSPRSLEILGLSDESAYPANVTNVGMSWTSPSQLELTYKGHVTVDFQVIKCAGIDIAVRDLSGETIKGSHETLTFSRSACRFRICPATGLIRTCESAWKWLYRTTRFDIEIYKGAYEAAIWQSIRFL